MGLFESKVPLWISSSTIFLVPTFILLTYFKTHVVSIRGVYRTRWEVECVGREPVLMICMTEPPWEIYFSFQVCASRILLFVVSCFERVRVSWGLSTKLLIKFIFYFTLIECTFSVSFPEVLSCKVSIFSLDNYDKSFFLIFYNIFSKYFDLVLLYFSLVSCSLLRILTHTNTHKRTYSYTHKLYIIN